MHTSGRWPLIPAKDEVNGSCRWSLIPAMGEREMPTDGHIFYIKTEAEKLGSFVPKLWITPGSWGEL